MTIIDRTLAPAWRWAMRFAAQTQGNVAMIFALVLPVLVMISLGGLDIHRASTVRMNLQDALDAATLAAARSQFTDDANITRVGLDSLRANLAPYDQITLLTEQTTFRLNSSGAVVGDAKVNVAALVANIVLPPYGQFLDDQLPVRAHSEVLRSNNRIEVALVLDNTGSMAGQKLANTKAAAIDLINRLEAADNRSIEPDAIKISLVPFSMTVRVHAGGTNNPPSYMSSANNHTGATGATGLFASGVSRFTLFQNLGTTWGGCVESRPAPYDMRDTPPTNGNQATMFVPYFSPDEPDKGDYPKDTTWQSWLNDSNSDDNDYVNDGSGNGFGTSDKKNPHGNNAARLENYWLRLKAVGKYSNTPRENLNTGFGPNQGCNLQPIIRLTDDYDALRAAVNNMVATGNTNVPLGAMWGWLTLSPSAPFGDGRPYGATRLQKIIIIMTDGENVMSDNGGPNDSFYNGLGYIWQDRIGISSGSNAQRRARMDQRFENASAGQEDMCGNMKAAGLEIYTVAVQVDSTAQTILRRCATDDDHYFPVNNANGIGDAFDRIAGAIENLRIAA